MLTKETTLPTHEELTVEECNLSSPYLKAAAFHLGKECEAVNNDFLLCKTEEKDPRKCLQIGKDVTKCSMSFFRKVKKNCADEFTDHAKCLDMSGPDMEYRYCRNTQAIFDTCMYEKLKMVRPPFGYFAEVRVHESSRPKPKPEPPAVYPDAVPEPKADDQFPNQGPARHGGRWFHIM